MNQKENVQDVMICGVCISITCVCPCGAVFQLNRIPGMQIAQTCVHCHRTFRVVQFDLGDDSQLNINVAIKEPDIIIPSIKPELTPHRVS